MKLVLVILGGWFALSMLLAAGWCVLRRYEKALLRRDCAEEDPPRRARPEQGCDSDGPLTPGDAGVAQGLPARRV